MREVTGRRCRTSKLGEVTATAAAFKQSLILQSFGEGEKINRFATLGEFAHSAEYKSMLFRIEGIGVDEVRNVVDGVGLQKQSAQEGALGFEGLRRNPVNSSHYTDCIKESSESTLTL